MPSNFAKMPMDYFSFTAPDVEIGPTREIPDISQGQLRRVWVRILDNCQS